MVSGYVGNRKEVFKKFLYQIVEWQCFGEDIEISKFLSLSLFLIFAPTWQSHERLAVIPSELGFANRAEPEVKETAEYVTWPIAQIFQSRYTDQGKNW